MGKWSPAERKKRAEKCKNPKGFTMKQFCKNLKTKSKKGERNNEVSSPRRRTSPRKRTSPKKEAFFIDVCHVRQRISCAQGFGHLPEKLAPKNRTDPGPKRRKNGATQKIIFEIRPFLFYSSRRGNSHIFVLL